MRAGEELFEKQSSRASSQLPDRGDYVTSWQSSPEIDEASSEKGGKFPPKMTKRKPGLSSRLLGLGR